MSLELVNTLATAIAAIVQLRHARSSNQIVALNELRESLETTRFSESLRFISSQLSIELEDPRFRYQIANFGARTAESETSINKIVTIGNFYETIGLLVKAGFLERDLALDLLAQNASLVWKLLAPIVAVFRRKSPVSYENFEFLTVLAEDWQAAHPKGTYPEGVRRIELKDRFLEADKQYAASLAPA